MKTVLIVFLLVSCGKPVVPEGAKYSCDTACQKQQELGCALGKPTAEGSSCVEVCKNSSDPLLAWNVEELSTAVNCEE